VTKSSGSNWLGLLGGLLDNEGTGNLAEAVQRVMDFAEADHRFVVSIQIRHNPKREND